MAPVPDVFQNPFQDRTPRPGHALGSSAFLPTFCLPCPWWVGFFRWDILMAPVPDVFRSPFQTAPLDLGTDAFYPSRREAIDRRLQVNSLPAVGL